MEIPPDDAIVQTVLAASADVGEPARLGGLDSWYDGATYTLSAGTPSVGFGPRSIAEAHTIDEYVAGRRPRALRAGDRARRDALLRDGMSTRILLVARHGQATQGPDHMWTPDDPLTELGHRQAADLAAHVAGLRRPPTRIVASPFLRAQETAAPCAEALGLPIETDPRLAEFASTLPSPWTLAETDELMPYDDIWHPGDAGWDGETIGSFFERTGAAAEDHARADEVALLVCHGGTTMGIIRWAMMIPPHEPDAFDLFIAECQPDGDPHAHRPPRPRAPPPAPRRRRPLPQRGHRDLRAPRASGVRLASECRREELGAGDSESLQCGVGRRQHIAVAPSTSSVVCRARPQPQRARRGPPRLRQLDAGRPGALPERQRVDERIFARVVERVRPAAVGATRARQRLPLHRPAVGSPAPRPRTRPWWRRG